MAGADVVRRSASQRLAVVVVGHRIWKNVFEAFVEAGGFDGVAHHSGRASARSHVSGMLRYPDRASDAAVHT